MGFLTRKWLKTSQGISWLIEQKKMIAATKAAASTQGECKKHLMRGKAREEAKSFEAVH
jgi:hypothetical protein